MLIRIAAVLAATLIALSMLVSVLFMEHRPQDNQFEVREGVLDLSGWDDRRDGNIKLSGQWEFYWDRLLTPGEAALAGSEQPDMLIDVPGIWSGLLLDEQRLPAHGTATYRIVLENVPQDGAYALRKTNIRFASAIYVNGQLALEDGVISADPAQYRAGNTSDIHFFSVDANTSDVEIVIHVANFDFYNSGIATPVYFGEQGAMLDAHKKSLALEYATVVVLVTIALIFFLIYVGSAIYKNRNDTLLLGILCLLLALHNGLVGDRVLMMYTGSISYDALFRLKDISTLLMLIVLVIYFKQLDKTMFPRKLSIGLYVIFAAAAVLTATLPMPVYIRFEVIAICMYFASIFWLLLRNALRFVRSNRTELTDSFLHYAAILCIVMQSVDMILFSLSLKENVQAGQLYTMIFSMLALIMAVLRLFSAYRTVNVMKDQLLQLDKLKDDFLSSTSHELKTPLNAIVNIADSLLRGAEGKLSETQAGNLSIIVGSGRKLSYLVDELLDYSKMKHGDIALYPTALNLHSAVDSIIRIHHFMLGGKRVRLCNQIDADFPAVYADGNRLTQILHNLIGNAVKFTEQGDITVSASLVKHTAEVRIADTGAGIAADSLERIFLPFQQEGTRSVPHAGGTGLGLSITRHLVELHGGSIHAQSVEGEGSVFTFTLPLVSAENQSGDLMSAAATDDGFPGNNAAYPIFVRGVREEKILVVDDDAANLQTIMNVLKLAGYSFALANRGRDALELLDRIPAFHLVIVDILMPDLSGYEVLANIRERYSPSDLPVLMLTASNKSSELRLAFEGGANDFVAKPFESEELLARVGNLTRLKSTVQEARNSEIAFLRSQINPHFLYNALNSIAELCLEMPEQAERLTLQLSRYLRSSITFKQLDSLTTLDNELEIVHAYVAIEKARFGDRLEVLYRIDADGGVNIPPLVLQPLVENAIRHGLMSRVSGGTVTLSVNRLPDGSVRFVVEDNGVGFSKEDTQAATQRSSARSGVALWNISSRLKLLFHTQLHIESEKGRGTRVSFELPAQSLLWRGDF